MVYEESDTDMLVAMPLPLTDLYHDGLSPWESCAELASRDPERTVFWGSVNPLEGRKALDLMERQVGDYGARALVGTACVQGLPDPGGPVRRVRLPAAHRPGEAEDPGREPAAP